MAISATELIKKVGGDAKSYPIEVIVSVTNTYSGGYATEIEAVATSEKLGKILETRYQFGADDTFERRGDIIDIFNMCNEAVKGLEKVTITAEPREVTPQMVGRKTGDSIRVKYSLRPSYEA